MIRTSGGLLCCLTAEHVITPKKRDPPSAATVLLNYYAEYMKFAGALGSSIRPLRRKYFRIDDLDIALSESMISGTAIDADSCIGAPASIFEDTSTLDSLHPEDLLLVAGFPGAHLTELRFMSSSNYGLHGYFFKAKDITSNAPDEHHYRITGSPIDFEPNGMSGSPVWLVRKPRENDGEDAGLFFDPIIELNGEFQLEFFGIVVRYLPHKRSFVAVKGEICRQFVRERLEHMPKIRDGSQHQQILDVVQDLTECSPD